MDSNNNNITKDMRGVKRAGDDGGGGLREDDGGTVMERNRCCTVKRLEGCEGGLRERDVRKG